MSNAPDPKRIEIARHIMEARTLAGDIDDAMLDYLLEMALSETLGHDAAARSAILQRICAEKGMP